jgi:hypothetical protein
VPMDTKAYADLVVLWVAGIYTVLLAVRYRTRFRARAGECVLVYILLLFAFIALPVMFGAVSAR